MIQYPYVVLRSPCRASYSLQVQRGQIFQRSPFAASSMVCGDCGSELFPCFFAVDVRLLNERETIYHYIHKETSSSGNEQDSFFSAGQNPSRAVPRRLVELPTTEQRCNRARIFSTQALSVQSYSLLGFACGSAVAFRLEISR